MSVSREQFLSHVHNPLQSPAAQSSPTKSTYRVRWRELSEWEDFISDAGTYWDNLAETEKNSVLPGVSDGYWDFMATTINSLATRLRREQHLRTPFSLLYGSPHNVAITDAGDEHAQITDQLPEDTVGEPDACFEYDNRIAGVIEVKTFWNLGETGLVEVLQGSLFFGIPLTVF